LSGSWPPGSARRGPRPRRPLYRLRLDDHADAIVSELTDLARQHDGQTLVPLCFENVHAGQHCHRRVFAKWFEGRYGIDVPELAIDVNEPQFKLRLSCRTPTSDVCLRTRSRLLHSCRA
jgi:hypothetical protein